MTHGDGQAGTRIPRTTRGWWCGPTFLVRAPALPIETFAALSAGGRSDRGSSDEPVVDQFLADPYVKLALSIASDSFVEALESLRLGEQPPGRLLRPLFSYLLRMSTRPTPFGLFAGVAQGEWSSRTELALGGRPAIRRARPDMAWLHAFARRWERKPEIRAGLVLRTHPAIRLRAGRVVVAEVPATGDSSAAVEASVRATPVVREALELCRGGARYSDVETALLCREGRDPAMTGQLLRTLCDRGFLTTSLVPALTNTPAEEVVHALDATPGGRCAARGLARLLEEVSAWETLPEAEASRRWTPLAKTALELESTRPWLQVDARFAGPANRVHRMVALEAARAVALLCRLSAWPAGPPEMALWRDQFEAAHGSRRSVPVLDLVSDGLPELGAAPVEYRRRDRLLLLLAVGALRSRRRVVELDEPRLAELESGGGGAGRLPESVELFCGVAATSEADLDAGRFQLVVSGTAVPAGRSGGRFAHLFDPASDLPLGSPTARLDTIVAEMLFEPVNPRSGNVMIRPIRASHVIHVNGGIPDRSMTVIPLDELAVTLDGSRLRLLWATENVFVSAVCSHMLNYRLAPALARFLHLVSRDGERLVDRFSWGPAEHLPFRPRLQSGRVVISRAEWSLGRSFFEGFTNDRAAALWAEALPRHVLLGSVEEHLLLDLKSDCGTALLLEAGEKLDSAHRVRVLEALPGPEHAFARGCDGHRLIELVVPVIRAVPSGDGGNHMPGRAAPLAERVRPPGSEWLYAKLYMGADLADDVIGGPIRTLTETMMADGLVSSWFFVRYTDTRFHVRLRLTGEPADLISSVLPRVSGWARQLIEDGVLDRFAFDTYERETERYGGPEAIAEVERLFAADSSATAGLMAARRVIGREMDLAHLSVWTVDDLLDGFGLDHQRRIKWYRENARLGSHAREFRADRAALRGLLGAEVAESDGRGRRLVQSILDERRRALERVARHLRELEERDHLWTPFDEVIRSVVHMHCNRLGGEARRAESRTLALAGLTVASLVARPADTDGASPFDTGNQSG